MRTSTTFSTFLFIALVLACLAGAPENATAATTRTVTSLLDDGGLFTLRNLIGDSVNGDTINFSVTGTITLTNNELLLQHSLTIIGPGPASLTVSGNNASRVFEINDETTNSISNLTIANGNTGGLGGGIYDGGNLTVNNCTFTRNAAATGGGIEVEGTVTMNNCTFSANTAPGGDGGGINNNQGYLTMNNCTVSANTAFNGGGIDIYGGTVTMNNCTVSANTTDFNGGGIVIDGGTATMNNCTVSANTTDFEGGGINTGGNVVTLHNTIIAGNTCTGDPTSGPDVWGTVTSQGHNLIGSTSGNDGFGATDLLNVNQLLGPLQDNGGPTFTMAPSLSPISAAIDAGDDAVLNAPLNLTTDQRGHPRKSGAHVDIGAYEVNPPTNYIVTVTNDSGAGSLRQAIMDAAPNDSITFAPGGAGIIALTTGELQIGKNLNITGASNAGVTVSGNHASRVFYLSSGTVSLSSLTIANGNSGIAAGGGILTEFGSTLILNNCTISGNAATNYASGNGDGGGVANYGTVLATNCTVSGNQAAEGGGLFNNSSGAYVLRNCTITSNSAVLFGGIWIYPGATTIIGSTIIAGNSADSNPDISGNSYVTSQGYNLIGINYSSTGITNGVNQDQAGSQAVPLNPRLGPLQNNGGPTFTHALLTGSPAIDQGKSFGLTTDQRGRLRPFDFTSITNATGGDGSDIGAYELNLPILNISRSTNNVIVSWSASDTGYTLQFKTNITPSVTWSNVLGTPVIVGGKNFVTNSGASGKKYYRLIQ